MPYHAQIGERSEKPHGMHDSWRVCYSSFLFAFSSFMLAVLSGGWLSLCLFLFSASIYARWPHCLRNAKGQEMPEERNPVSLRYYFTLFWSLGILDIGVQGLIWDNVGYYEIMR